MPLETGNYIADLVPSNPPGTDGLSQADDHLRLLKKCVQQSFAAVAGAVSASDVELSYVAGVTSAIQTQLNAITARLDALEGGGGLEAFPVGALYFSLTDVDPATTLGYGIWAAEAAGRVIVGVGTGNDGTDQQAFAAGDERGTYKHTLIEGEIPPHLHLLAANENVNPGSPVTALDQVAQRREGTGGSDYTLVGTPTAATVGRSSSTGGGQAHANEQPSYAVYIWRRTA